MIRERFGFIAEVLGVAAVEEGGKVYLWAWPPCQTTYRSTNTRECGAIVL